MDSFVSWGIISIMWSYLRSWNTYLEKVKKVVEKCYKK